MRYVWCEAADLYLLIDMKEQIPIGSILTGGDNAYIIRYGHHPKSEPMQEEIIDIPGKQYQRFLKAAAAIEARLLIPSDECDDRIIIRHAAEVLDK